MTHPEELHRLGLRPGDTVMVHASMRAVGGRAEDLVRALLAAVGSDGTLVAYVDFQPTDSVPGFDLAASPAVPEHGVLAEVVRRWPGAVRSANPGASMAAIGARARWLCASHPLRYGYGRGTPLGRLVEARGRVLLLGSHLDHVTLLHHAEHLARLPGKRVVRYSVPSAHAPAGGVLEVEEFDTSDGVVAAMPDGYFAQVVGAFIEAGLARTGRVGGATSHLMDAAELTRFAVERMERDFG